MSRSVTLPGGVHVAVLPTLRSAGVALVLSLLVGAGLWVAGSQVFSLRIPYALYVAVLFAVLVGRGVAASVRPPPVLTSPVREDTEIRAYGVPDRPFADVRRWEERLDLIRGDPDYFQRAVVPVLATAVDERLRIAHGLTRASDPARAREILGPRLWDFLEEGTRAPSPAELALVVQEMEEVWEQRH